MFSLSDGSGHRHGTQAERVDKAPQCTSPAFHPKKTEGYSVARFYPARCRPIRPLPWTIFAPPFSLSSVRCAPLTPSGAFRHGKAGSNFAVQQGRQSLLFLALRTVAGQNLHVAGIMVLAVADPVHFLCQLCERGEPRRRRILRRCPAKLLRMPLPCGAILEQAPAVPAGRTVVID